MKQLLGSRRAFRSTKHVVWNPENETFYLYRKKRYLASSTLQKTVSSADTAYTYMKEVSENGGIALFVGTKKQAQEAN